AATADHYHLNKVYALDHRPRPSVALRAPHRVTNWSLQLLTLWSKPVLPLFQPEHNWASCTDWAVRVRHIKRWHSAQGDNGYWIYRVYQWQLFYCLLQAKRVHAYFSPFFL